MTGQEQPERAQPEQTQAECALPERVQPEQAGTPCSAANGKSCPESFPFCKTVSAAGAEASAPRPEKGRFAPTPSGRMHLGNVFCALLAWLSAKSAGGTMVLRIEDLDTLRCSPVYTRQIMDDLAWLGLTWDEGGEMPGYVQSGESARYAAAVECIARQARVYPCYCSRTTVRAAAAPHPADAEPVYAGTCRSLTPAQRAAFEKAGRKASLRVTVPDEVISFTDGVCGAQRENLAADCGDFILRRSDGGYAYQLAVVADDARMGVTQVVRGRDLLSSTARQLWLYRLLDAAPPRFFHIPMLCDAAGRRLAKRDRDFDMGAVRARCTPQQLTGALGRLAGLGDGSPCTPAALCAAFSWDSIPRADICVDPAALLG